MSFSSLRPENALYNDANHLIHHIRKISKSDANFQFKDLDYNKEIEVPKLIIRYSTFFQWCIRGSLKYLPEKGNDTTDIMTLIGSLMAIEDIELLSQLYKGLDYEQRSAVYSDSKLELLKIIISQQSSNMEQLKAKSGSFEDIILNAKCNFPDCKLELVSPQPQNNDTDKKRALKIF